MHTTENRLFIAGLAFIFIASCVLFNVGFTRGDWVSNNTGGSVGVYKFCLFTLDGIQCARYGSVDTFNDLTNGWTVSAAFILGTACAVSGLCALFCIFAMCEPAMMIGVYITAVITAFFGVFGLVVLYPVGFGSNPVLNQICPGASTYHIGPFCKMDTGYILASIATGLSLLGLGFVPFVDRYHARRVTRQTQHHELPPMTQVNPQYPQYPAEYPPQY
ncbi:hypothetical protein CAOG_01751 [Capsaspora owczarzaki ATCC 30864]|uniref:hypothetical protein n=1 Tax=Capsaspora owczarzaki (strain ATCC 30864) TaxID=595528 RepID=UPI0003520EA5|nr:hypothetical protein CAOG_01751 [Capsaspora owczarzaki ATCC 30864]|eukprot:XP_004364619.2 hypothetical protein CAOG_01751 [Capsaspora owczarzaki ATCC 30864]